VAVLSELLQLTERERVVVDAASRCLVSASRQETTPTKKVCDNDAMMMS
jgi:hypothetical protein